MDKEIRIVLSNQVNDCTTTKEEQVSNRGVDNFSDSYNSSIQNESYSTKIFVAGMAKKAVDSTINMVTEQAQWSINREFNLTDDYLSQRNYQIAQTMVGTVLSDVSSVVSWTTTGATMGGPWGAVVGAVVGTAFTATNRALAISRAKTSQEDRVRIMEAGLSYNRQRAGFSLNSGSIGENL